MNSNIQKNEGSGILTGKSFVISGVFERYSRDELKSLVESLGGQMKSSLSKNTSYLLAGDKAGPSKLTKAEKLEIFVLNEDEFVNLIS